MAHFARLSDSKVVEVIVLSNDSVGEPNLNFPETEVIGQVFIAKTLGLDGEWRQTSYNGNFRGRFAGIGFTYDSRRDEFVPPDWTLIDGEWTAPPEPETV